MGEDLGGETLDIVGLLENTFVGEKEKKKKKMFQGIINESQTWPLNLLLLQQLYNPSFLGNNCILINNMFY